MEIKIISDKKQKSSVPKGEEAKLEWSKVLTVLVLVPYIAVIILAVFIATSLLATGEADGCVSVIQALLAFVAAPLAVAYGFYFWKSKAENLVKLAKDLKHAGVSDDITEEIVKTDEIGGK